MFTLPKSKKLTGDIRIQRVFSTGESCVSFPLRVCYLTTEAKDEPVQILVGVPKKMFKRAVKRNALKRLMREAYCLNQQQLLDLCAKQNIGLEVAFTYITNKEIDFETMEKAMKKAMRKIEKKIAVE